MNVHKPLWKPLSRGIVSFLIFCASALPAFAQNQIDLSRLVVVGDSLAAGVENGSLEYAQQEHGFAAVIARQAATPLTLPLVPYPGAPNTLELVSPGFPPVIQPVPGTLFFPRFNPFAIVTDVAVPLQTVADALDRKPSSQLQTNDETQLATDVVLGFPCPILLPCPALTQVEYAVALRPTALIINIGNNDILGAITSGQLSSLSGPAFLANFTTSYSSLLTRLASTHAALVVANIADVTEAAYFIPASVLAQELPPVVFNALGIGPNDYVTLAAFPAIEAILSGSASGPLSPTCVSGSSTPCVVTATEAAAVRSLTIALNQIIQTEVAANKGTLVDLFSLVDNLTANGYQVNGQTLTTNFLGGLFSLDGLHPTNTGYGIVANEFIKDINAAFHTHIPLANIAAIADRDPLVNP